MARLSVITIAGVLVLLAVPTLPSANGQSSPSRGWYIDDLASTLTVDLDVGNNGSIDERIYLSQTMKIRRFLPYINDGDGKRYVELEVLEWYSSGHSNVLNKDITMATSLGVAQPRGYAVAQTAGVDYPVTVYFNVIYDVAVNGVPQLTRLPGTATATNVNQLPPPAGTSFTVAKDILIPDVGGSPLRMISVLCACANSVTAPTGACCLDAECTSCSVITPSECSARAGTYKGDFTECETFAPIPTVSEWGLVVLTLLLLTAGTIILRRQWRGRPAMS